MYQVVISPSPGGLRQPDVFKPCLSFVLSNVKTEINTKVPVTGLKVSCYEVPTQSFESDGTFEWKSTVMVVVEVTAGDHTGIGYTYADVSTGSFIRQHLSKVVTGKNALDNTRIWDDMYVSIRNLGHTGISSMAIAAVDGALWDLKGKLLNLPLVVLLGQVREDIPVYGSGGFTSYTPQQFNEQFNRWVDEGFYMFKMKVGRHQKDDVKRVEFARRIIGNSNQLFVDANGAYTVRQALQQANAFREFDVSWFEEPVSSENLQGLNFIRKAAPPEMNITAGEYGFSIWYFLHMLQHESVDVMQVDATRCGGITGFLKASTLCEAYQIPVSAHTAPWLHMQGCCAIANAVHIEYFFDHARIEEMFFDGYAKPVKGKMIPNLDRPGLGVALKKKDMKPYLIS